MIDRGLGLLEIIMPGAPEFEGATALPPGQRDDEGFWFPAGVTQPGDIFSAEQRRMQAKQRQVQRRRRRPRKVIGGDGAMTRQESSGAAHSPPSAPLAEAAGHDPGARDISLPLPAPRLETDTAAAPRRETGTARPARSLAGMLGALGAALSVPAPPSHVVDSKKGSD